MLYEDLRDLERVREVSLIDLLLQHLPRCVGSPLSVKGLSLLLQVSHASTERWISILERLYVCFRIPPFGGARIRAVRKEIPAFYQVHRGRKDFEPVGSGARVLPFSTFCRERSLP